MWFLRRVRRGEARSTEAGGRHAWNYIDKTNRFSLSLWKICCSLSPGKPKVRFFDLKNRFVSRFFYFSFFPLSLLLSFFPSFSYFLFFSLSSYRYFVISFLYWREQNRFCDESFWFKQCIQCFIAICKNCWDSLLMFCVCNQETAPAQQVFSVCPVLTFPCLQY